MRIDLLKAMKTLPASLALLAALSCSAHAATFSIGGKMADLKASESAVLLNNGGNALIVNANGNFAFSTKLATGAKYNVTVRTQPAGQICTVANGTGTVGTVSVTSIKVTCANAYTIGGSITGLDVKDKLTLLDNGGDALAIEILASTTKPVSFTFHTLVATGASYAVTVGTPPTGQVCTVAKGTGKVASAAVTSVVVTCVKGYTIGGSVANFRKGESITLLDNGGNALTVNGTISGEANFTFTAALANNATYKVTIGTQPLGDTCTVSKGSGKVTSANVTTVKVVCEPNPYTVGGTITGLDKSHSITLLDNGRNPLTLVGAGSNIKFAFKATVLSGAGYDVTISKQPADQVCTVTHGSGIVGSADVNSVVVTCTIGYTIGGTITGLKTGQTVTFFNNSANELNVNGTDSGNVGFTFTTALANGASYNVTVIQQPLDENCTVSKGSGR